MRFELPAAGKDYERMLKANLSCLFLSRNYAIMVTMFFTVSVINNYALNFNIAMPLHMIFRSVRICHITSIRQPPTSV